MVHDIRYCAAPILFVTRKFAVSRNEIRRYGRTWSRAFTAGKYFFPWQLRENDEKERATGDNQSKNDFEWRNGRHKSLKPGD